MVHIYPFTPDDLPALREMYQSQNAPLGDLDPKTLPEVGFVVKDDTGMPIAAGFLRRVEGGFGQLDTFMTNKQAPGEVRHHAIDLLTQTLIATGKNIGLLGLMAITTKDSILTRAMTHGFRLHLDVVLTLSYKD